MKKILKLIFFNAILGVKTKKEFVKSLNSFELIREAILLLIFGIMFSYVTQAAASHMGLFNPKPASEYREAILVKYVVEDGDTLSAIAEKYRPMEFSYSQYRELITEVNHFSYFRKLKTGETVLLPAYRDKNPWWESYSYKIK